MISRGNPYQIVHGFCTFLYFAERLVVAPSTNCISQFVFKMSMLSYVIPSFLVHSFDEKGPCFMKKKRKNYVFRICISNALDYLILLFYCKEQPNILYQYKLHETHLPVMYCCRSIYSSALTLLFSSFLFFLSRNTHLIRRV